jgi:histidinol dehydrogenase
MTVRPLAALERDLRTARRGGAFGTAERDAAERVIADVRRRGDAAVLASVRRFDRRTAAHADLVADRRAIRRAADRCAPELARALERAHGRIGAFHARQRPKPVSSRRRSAASARSSRAVRAPIPPPRS